MRREPIDRYKPHFACKPFEQAKKKSSYHRSDMLFGKRYANQMKFNDYLQQNEYSQELVDFYEEPYKSPIGYVDDDSFDNSLDYSELYYSTFQCPTLFCMGYIEHNPDFNNFLCSEEKCPVKIYYCTLSIDLDEFIRRLKDKYIEHRNLFCEL